MSGFADDAKEAEKLAQDNAGTVDKGVQEGEKEADQLTGDRFDKEIGEAGQELDNQVGGGNGNGNGNGQQTPAPSQPGADQSGS